MSVETISYSYMDECQERHGEWTGDRDDALAEAVRHLNVIEAGEETWILRSSATDGWWRVSDEGMASYGAAMLDGHTSEEVYSLWCAGSGGGSEIDVATWARELASTEHAAVARAQDGSPEATAVAAAEPAWTGEHTTAFAAWLGVSVRDLPDALRDAAEAAYLDA